MAVISCAGLNGDDVSIPKRVSEVLWHTALLSIRGGFRASFNP